LIGRRFCGEQRLGESVDGAGEIEAVIEAPLESGEISVGVLTSDGMVSESGVEPSTVVDLVDEAR
jgi:hypothetical protein